MNLNQERFRRRLAERLLPEYENLVKTICRRYVKSVDYNKAGLCDDIYPAALYGAYQAMLTHDPGKGRTLVSFIDMHARFQIKNHMRSLRHGPRTSPVQVDSLSQSAPDGELYHIEVEDPYQEDPYAGTAENTDLLRLFPPDGREMVRKEFFELRSPEKAAESLDLGIRQYLYQKSELLSFARYMAGVSDDDQSGRVPKVAGNGRGSEA